MTDAALDIAMVGPCPEDPSFIKGGVQASVLGLLRALPRQSGVGRVICISIPLYAEPGRPVTEGAIDGIHVTYLSTPLRFIMSCVFHLPRTIRAIRALPNPVVHVHSNGVFQASLCLLLKLRHIPFVWTLHGISEKETRERYREDPTIGNALRYVVYTLMEWIMLRASPEILVDTPYVKEAIKAHGTVHVLPIGIFTQEFLALRDLPRTAPVVLSLGVIDPRKGHHLTLEAFAQVKNAVPEAKLVIAGSLTIPSYLDELKSRATELGVSNAVEFLIERPRTEIVACLGRARVLALHSREESQGIALCEALASGVPIVATRIGGIPYVVTDGEDGFLIAYADVPAFAEAIRRLLTDGMLHRGMSQKAIASSQRFDWQNIAGEVMKVYRRTAKSI